MTQGEVEASWPEPWWRPWLTHPLMVGKWIVVAALFALVAWLRPAWALVLVPVGFLLWFPLEYLTHRYIFHFFVESDRLFALSQKHVTHHAHPNTLEELFIDPSRMTLMGLPLFGLYCLITWDIGQGVALMAGTYSGLVYYEYMHLLTHSPHTKPKAPWTKAMKRWHLLHHFKHEQHWFGVTTRTFDRAVGSDPDPDDVETSDTVRTLGVVEENRAWMEEHG